MKISKRLRVFLFQFTSSSLTRADNILGESYGEFGTDALHWFHHSPTDASEDLDKLQPDLN